MDNLVGILDSFQLGWKGKKLIEDFTKILKEMVGSTHPFREGETKNNPGRVHGRRI